MPTRPFPPSCHGRAETVGESPRHGPLRVRHRVSVSGCRDSPRSIAPRSRTSRPRRRARSSPYPGPASIAPQCRTTPEAPAAHHQTCRPPPSRSPATPSRSLNHHAEQRAPQPLTPPGMCPIPAPTPCYVHRADGPTTPTAQSQSPPRQARQSQRPIAHHSRKPLAPPPGSPIELTCQTPKSGRRKGTGPLVPVSTPGPVWTFAPKVSGNGAPPQYTLHGILAYPIDLTSIAGGPPNSPF